MNKISAKVIAASENECGEKLVSMILTFPRFILAELNTHRLFSRNSASSRAIPFKKMVEMAKEDPVIPIAWQAEHKGMQGSNYLEYEEDNEVLKRNWLHARDYAVQFSTRLNEDHNVTKQLCNRLLEPFMWHTVLVTSSEWKNFFDLRTPSYCIDNVPILDSNLESAGTVTLVSKSKKETLNNIGVIENNLYDDLKTILGNYTDLDWLKINKGMAEIHMMALGEAIYDAYSEAEFKQLKPGEWHIPFGDTISLEKIAELLSEKDIIGTPILNKERYMPNLVQIATARCARVSYLNYEGIDDYVKDYKLFEQLKDSKHLSPFEHCAKAMSKEDYDNYLIIEDGKVYPGWCRNFRGFIQLRALLDPHT